MKNIYTSALACAAMLLAGSSMAQSSSKETHAPVSGYQTLHHSSGVSTQRGGGAPANDDCSGATVHNLSLGGNVVINGDNTGATDGEGFGFATVWDGFSVTSCANVTVSFCGTTPAFGNFALGIGDCPTTTVLSPNSQSDCDDGNLTLVYEGVPAGTWYVPVLTEDGSMGPYVLTISAVACATPPSNDECAGAISLTSGANCNLTYANTIGATPSMDPLNCNGAGLSPTSKDVWFSFVCTSTEQSIGMVGYNAFDGVIELFSGSCGNLTSLGCADDTYPASADESVSEVLDQTGLTVGSTYYFRIYDWGETSSTHTFATCVTEGSENNVGIDEQHKATALSVYPNPGSGDFNLQYTGADGLGTIEVLDLTGRTVYSEQTQMVNGATHTMNLSKLAQGQYSLRLTVNGARSQQNLMVR